MKTEERVIQDTSEIINRLFELKSDLELIDAEEEKSKGRRIDAALSEMLELYEMMNDPSSSLGVTE